MKAIADTMGVSRSHLIERMKPKAKPARSRYNKADDAWLLPLIGELVDHRMTYGYRRIRFNRGNSSVVFPPMWKPTPGRAPSRRVFSPLRPHPRAFSLVLFAKQYKCWSASC